MGWPAHLPLVGVGVCHFYLSFVLLGVLWVLGTLGVLRKNAHKVVE